jgi:hypothetical protein
MRSEPEHIVDEINEKKVFGEWLRLTLSLKIEEDLALNPFDRSLSSFESIALSIDSVIDRLVIEIRADEQSKTVHYDFFFFFV